MVLLSHVPYAQISMPGKDRPGEWIVISLRRLAASITSSKGPYYWLHSTCRRRNMRPLAATTAQLPSGPRERGGSNIGRLPLAGIGMDAQARHLPLPAPGL